MYRGIGDQGDLAVIQFSFTIQGSLLKRRPQVMYSDCWKSCPHLCRYQRVPGPRCRGYFPAVTANLTYPFLQGRVCLVGNNVAAFDSDPVTDIRQVRFRWHTCLFSPSASRTGRRLSSVFFYSGFPSFSPSLVSLSSAAPRADTFAVFALLTSGILFFSGCLQVRFAVSIYHMGSTALLFSALCKMCVKILLAQAPAEPPANA